MFIVIITFKLVIFWEEDLKLQAYQAQKVC